MPTYTCPGGDSDGMSVGTAPPAWVGGLGFMTIAANVPTRSVAGVRFTGMPFVTRNDGVLNPLSFTYTDQVITSINMTFEVSVGATVTAPTTLSLFVLNEVDPAEFSTARNPFDLKSIALEVARTPISAANLINTPYAFITPDPDNPSAIAAGVAAKGLAHVNGVWRRRGTLGNMAFIIDFTDPSVGSGNFMSLATTEDGVRDDPLFNTVEFTDITGINKHWRAHSRADRCPKCGSLTVREKLVEDGFKRGLLVCQSCWDPPDFHSEWGRRGVGRERQGIND